MARGCKVGACARYAAPMAVKRTPNKKTPTAHAELVAFYRAMMTNPDLKAAERIAAAKRLEALLLGHATEETPKHATVTLNLPEVADER